jgi:hypothetical protein
LAEARGLGLGKVVAERAARFLVLEHDTQFRDRVGGEALKNLATIGYQKNRDLSFITSLNRNYRNFK